MRDRSVLSEDFETTFSKGEADQGCPLVLTGGFPCQDLSIAGKQAGLSGERSGLWREFKRIIEEISPDWIVIENVAHTWRRWVPEVRRDLWQLGYDSLPLRVRASDLGAPHERARIFLVANANGELLRDLSRWWVGPGREMVDEFARAIACKQVAHAAGERRVEEREDCRRVETGGASKGHLGRGSSRRSSITGKGWWAAEPGIRRVAHGIPNRVDRLKSLGNAVVPQIAQIIAEGIKAVNPSTPKRGEKEE